jgi:hypothetical protein
MAENAAACRSRWSLTKLVEATDRARSWDAQHELVLSINDRNLWEAELEEGASTVAALVLGHSPPW